MVDIISSNVEVHIPEEDFYDLCDTAGYGINYWCDKAEVLEPGEESKLMPGYIASSPCYLIHEVEEDQMHVALKVFVEMAWERLLNGEAQCNEEILGYLRSGDMGDIDALAADVLIQVAIFEKIVYG